MAAKLNNCVKVLAEMKRAAVDETNRFFSMAV
jgi:hypothetical protein